jgi:hypothetical protein
MTELNESEIRKMPFFVTWHTMFLSHMKNPIFQSVNQRIPSDLSSLKFSTNTEFKHLLIDEFV